MSCNLIGHFGVCGALIFTEPHNLSIDQFRYIKIQPKTIDLITRLWGITTVCGVYSPEPRAEVYCVRLNISKLVYYLELKFDT